MIESRTESNPFNRYAKAELIPFYFPAKKKGSGWSGSFIGECPLRDSNPLKVDPNNAKARNRLARVKARETAR
jgi:hypothetical protein